MPSYFDASSQGGDPFNDFLARYLQGQQSAHVARVNLARLLSRSTVALVQDAASYSREHGHGEVDALHLLHVMATREPAAALITSAGADPAKVAEAAKQRLPESRPADRDGGELALTASAQRSLFHAYQVARASGSSYIEPEHLLFALALAQDATAGQVLHRAGVTPERLQGGGESTQSLGSAESAPGSAESALATYSVDLTDLAERDLLDPVIGREEEIEQAVEILSRRTKNNPVLIGEAGVGKTAVVEGLARKIVAGDVPAALADKRVVSLDMASMLAGTRYRGDFEERMKAVIDEIAQRSDELIVFIDELHTVVGAGGGGQDSGMDASNILKPRLARGELNLIGATTLKEYRTIEKDSAFERRFQPITVLEPSTDDAVTILRGLSGAYAEHHGVTYTDDALAAAVRLSDRYLSDRRLPDKAIDLIDQAGARRRLAAGPKADPTKLKDELSELEERKAQAVAAEDYEGAGRLRDEMAGLTDRLAQHESAGGESLVVDEHTIADVVARATGIPVARIDGDEKARLARLEEDLHERVIGQNDAVEAVAQTMRRSRTGMADPSRPSGSFLFLGPTGVGKTELAKAVAASLFGSEAALKRFDMSEFGERHTVSRLVGSPPGYVGYDEAGQLTEQVRRQPYSVILLDEIEKAHPDVFNMLLQVLDDGRLTDGQGRTVDFRNTVIIMTSNIGSEFLASRSGALGFVAEDSADGFGHGEVRRRVDQALREVMRPEFLNRIDEIVLFDKLSRAQLEAIVRLVLESTRRRLDEQGLRLTVTEEAVRRLASEGYRPEYGARPLRRVVQRRIDDRIADLIVAGRLDEGDTVVVDADADAIVVGPGAREHARAA